MTSIRTVAGALAAVAAAIDPDAATGGGAAVALGSDAAEGGGGVATTGSGPATVAAAGFSTPAVTGVGAAAMVSVCREAGGGAEAMVDPLAVGLMLSTSTIVAPPSMPSLWAAVYDTSIRRPSTNGPRSLTRTTTELPVLRLVTRA